MKQEPSITNIKTNETIQVLPPPFCTMFDSEMQLTHFAAFITLPLQTKNAFPVRVLKRKSKSFKWKFKFILKFLSHFYQFRHSLTLSDHLQWFMDKRFGFYIQMLNTSK